MRCDALRPAPPDSLDLVIVDEGYRIVTGGEPTRTILMTRFMQVLMRTHWYERTPFLETLIAGEDLRSLRDYEPVGILRRASLFRAGAAARCRVDRCLIARHGIFDGPAHSIDVPAAID